MSRVVLGIDPGVTTGMCVVTTSDISLRYLGQEAHHTEEVLQYIREVKPDVVVVEDFIIGRHHSEYKVPLKLIGVIEYYCWRAGISYACQSPNVLYGMRKKLGESIPGGPHINSAYMHALYFILKEKKNAKP